MRFKNCITKKININKKTGIARFFVCQYVLFGFRCGIRFFKAYIHQ